ncbi:MAG: peptidase domain-containing ABC transporter [Saprospiraceae bacterium]|nr:peptidase domain-containing ABC transporter [Saprospiraceae bacterium]
MTFRKFPNYIQLDQMDCGPSCLRIICKFYGKSLSPDYLRKLSAQSRTGTSLLGLSEAAEQLGFRSIGLNIHIDELIDEAPLPLIAHWKHRHFVVVYKTDKHKVYVSDPAHGLLSYTRAEFMRHWSDGQPNGIVLVLEPMPEFFEQKEEPKDQGKRDFRKLVSYLSKHRKGIVQLIIGLFVGSILQLMLPFMTQSIVDIGIAQRNISFIYLILMAQLMVFLGRVCVEILRSVILAYISSRISISLLSDFFIKLLRLRISFFDTKITGDILQRIGDHQRIESFLTTGTLDAIFSVINLVIFGAILAYYNVLIFAIFLIGSLLYFIWIFSFLKKRAEFDYRRFNQMSDNNDKNLELIYGVQEIKLNNAETKKRWEWEYLQVKMFKINLEGIKIEQVQAAGSSFINELKNILVTFLAAKMVLDGQITLGMMLSISYITGQLNVPIIQLVNFVKAYQDARLSMERINEMHNKPDEDSDEGEERAQDLPADKTLRLQNVSFKYEATSRGAQILKDISIEIPGNKVTAIVGASGSGKTTLMKLLLKFYEPNAGSIQVGNLNLSGVSHKAWRNASGVVMQEGYLFSDTIAANIAVSDDKIDMERVIEASKIACIYDYIINMPLKFNSKIGGAGQALSVGQKQRILIARAIYKNPDYLFFDEATSSLDATTERLITDNLDQFFHGRTVVVIAHRLSTVRNADQIIVLDNGMVQEIGNHKTLTEKRGTYFHLVKNQLELGA